MPQHRGVPRAAGALVCIVLGLALLAGCGDDQPAEAADVTSSSTPAPSRTPTSPTPSPTRTATPTQTPSPSDDAAVEVEIEIEDGDVEPAGAEVEATVGDEVVLRVDSDVPDELHVHSAPTEQDFAVGAAPDQRFRFTVEQPGQFDVELHESGVLVAQLVVRP